MELEARSRPNLTDVRGMDAYVQKCHKLRFTSLAR